jgi:hypothetical protein
MLGVGVELLLIDHVEDWKQLLPLIALGVAVAALAWHVRTGGGASRMAVRLAMLGLVAAGVAGLVLHYESNEEFQRELDPSLEGLHLVWATLRQHSPPALAPGVLGIFGALGWIATRREAPPSERTTT